MQIIVAEPAQPILVVQSVVLSEVVELHARVGACLPFVDFREGEVDLSKFQLLYAYSVLAGQTHKLAHGRAFAVGLSYPLTDRQASLASLNLLETLRPECVVGSYGMELAAVSEAFSVAESSDGAIGSTALGVVQGMLKISVLATPRVCRGEFL